MTNAEKLNALADDAHCVSNAVLFLDGEIGPARDAAARIRKYKHALRACAKVVAQARAMADTAPEYYYQPLNDALRELDEVLPDAP